MSADDLAAWVAANPDPFEVAEMTAEELRERAVDGEDDRRAERWER